MDTNLSSLFNSKLNISENIFLGKIYKFCTEYDDNYIYQIFINDILPYLTYIEETSTKKKKRYYSIKSLNNNYKKHLSRTKNNTKNNKIIYCIESHEELTGVILLYFTRCYNMSQIDIVKDFINIERKIKFDHDQDVINIKKKNNNKRKNNNNLSDIEIWRSDFRWCNFTFTFYNLIDSIYHFQEGDTMVSDGSDIIYGHQQSIYVSKIIGNSLLYYNRIPYEIFYDTTFDLNNIKIHENNLIFNDYNNDKFKISTTNVNIYNIKN